MSAARFHGIAPPRWFNERLDVDSAKGGDVMRVQQTKAWLILLLVAMLAAVASAVPVRSAKPGKDLAALEQKLHGQWDGQRGCDGKFTFRPNGTFKLTQYGPAGMELAGTWEVRWSALPPSLILNCQESNVDDYTGEIMEMKITELDDLKFSCKHPDHGAASYARAKE